MGRRKKYQDRQQLSTYIKHIERQTTSISKTRVGWREGIDVLQSNTGHASSTAVPTRKHYSHLNLLVGSRVADDHADISNIDRVNKMASLHTFASGTVKTSHPLDSAEVARRQRIGDRMIQLASCNKSAVKLSLSCCQTIARYLEAYDQGDILSAFDSIEPYLMSALSIYCSLLGTMSDTNITLFSMLPSRLLMMGESISSAGLQSLAESSRRECGASHLSLSSSEDWEDLADNTCVADDDTDHVTFRSYLQVLCICGSDIQINDLATINRTFLNLCHLVVHKVAFTSIASPDPFYFEEVCDEFFNNLSLGFDELTEIEISCCRWLTLSPLRLFCSKLSSMRRSGVSSLKRLSRITVSTPSADKLIETYLISVSRPSRLTEVSGAHLFSDEEMRTLSSDFRTRCAVALSFREA